MTSTFDPQRVHAICFDVDGTLSDTDDLAVRRLSRFLRPAAWLRGEPAAQRWARRIVMAAETPLNQLYETTDRLGIDAFLFQLVHALRGVFPSHTAQYLLIPGVETLLTTLSTRYPLAIVSARPRASTLAFLDHFSLRPYFGNCIATAETCERTKPDPSPLLWAAKCMDVPPEACLMVGDTTVDIRAGKAAGAQTVGVLCGFGEEGELRRAGADLILPSTADLLNYLP